MVTNEKPPPSHTKGERLPVALALICALLGSKAEANVTLHQTGSANPATSVSWSGGRATVTTPLHETKAELYDGRSRLASRQLSPSPATSAGGTLGLSSTRFEYDGWDALRRLDETHLGTPQTNATTAWAYNPSHLLESVSRGPGLSVNYSHHEGTRRRATRGPVSWSYDSLGRLSQVAGPWGNTAVSWEAGGQRLAQLGNEGFSYDGRGWLTAITNTANSALSRSYTYDGRGNRDSETQGARTRRFAIDDTDRLVAVQEWDGHIEAWKLKADGAKEEEKHFPAGTAWPVAFDDEGAVLHRQFNYHAALGVLESIAGADGGSDFLRYTFDANGQATSRTVNGDTANYKWDVDGRLVQATTPPGPGLTTLNAVYGYDGFGMRRRADVTLTPPTGPPSSATRNWNWAGEDGKEEVDEDGRVTTSVGPYRVGEGETRFSHDALGSVTGQSDNLNVGFIDYSAWGQPAITGTITSSAAFAGGRAELLLGLNQNGDRWLDSLSGIFLSRDSVDAGSYLSTPNGLGPWSYAAANPLRYADPDGRNFLDMLRLMARPTFPGQPRPVGQKEAAYLVDEAPADAYALYERGVDNAHQATQSTVANVNYALWGGTLPGDAFAASQTAGSTFVADIPFGVLNLVTRPHRVAQGIGSLPGRFVDGAEIAGNSTLPLESRALGVAQSLGAGGQGLLLFAAPLRAGGIRGPALSMPRFSRGVVSVDALGGIRAGAPTATAPMLATVEANGLSKSLMAELFDPPSLSGAQYAYTRLPFVRTTGSYFTKLVNGEFLEIAHGEAVPQLVPRTASSSLRSGATALLPGELRVGQYQTLIKRGSIGDDLTPHHIPSNAYMSEVGPVGYTRGKGVSMMMEQPSPGVGGRHRMTSSYGATPDTSIKPRNMLAREVWDSRQIYRSQGLYSRQVRSALQQVIEQNTTAWPDFFAKPK